MLNFQIITLFPEMFTALDSGITGKALRQQQISINCINPRDFTQDVHHTVDDRPYGGGPGMVMKVEPLQQAILQAKANASKDAKLIYLSPQGKKLDQQYAERLTSRSEILLLAGRYEGIDERLIDLYVDEECSIGDFVLSGGELAAMVLIDAVTRLLPGVLGHPDSAKEDSFAMGLLDCPHYTRPETIENISVPPVLLSGNHENIRQFRLQQSLIRTWLKRPDLLATKQLTKHEIYLLLEFLNTKGGN